MKIESKSTEIISGGFDSAEIGDPLAIKRPWEKQIDSKEEKDE